MWYQQILLTGLLAAIVIAGCSADQETTSDAPEQSQSRLVVKYDTPAPMEVSARTEPQSDEDWKAIANNKNAEIVELLNIINPIAAYITAAFEQHGSIFAEVTHEEWEDTRAQLTNASTIYGDCQKRMESGAFDKQLFLDLEEAWQVFVKVGVAGLRTKTMVEADLARAS